MPPAPPPLAPPRAWAVLVLLCLAASGCSERKDECEGARQGAEGGQLAFGGECDGTQESSFDCDGTAHVTFAANVLQGGLGVEVEDSSGKPVYRKSQGLGTSSEGEDAAGAAGTWTATATRGGDFSGQYALVVDCGAEDPQG